MRARILGKVKMIWFPVHSDLCGRVPWAIRSMTSVSGPDKAQKGPEVRGPFVFAPEARTLVFRTFWWSAEGDRTLQLVRRRANVGRGLSGRFNSIAIERAPEIIYKFMPGSSRENLCE